MQVIAARKEIITELLQNTVDLSTQLSGLVRENRAALAPALRDLQGVIKVLNDNQASLYRGIQNLAPFLRLFTNTLGNGHWFDTYVANLGPLTPGVGGTSIGGVTGGGVVPGAPGGGIVPQVGTP